VRDVVVRAVFEDSPKCAAIRALSSPSMNSRWVKARRRTARLAFPPGSVPAGVVGTLDPFSALDTFRAFNTLRALRALGALDLRLPLVAIGAAVFLTVGAAIFLTVGAAVFLTVGAAVFLAVGATVLLAYVVPGLREAGCGAP